ncbi:T-cell receptor-associated transmembrane adapter 1 [Bombina bombina]|uniref:T-cell receptor-associated transmembrane adapter 1 n=1 Tax=Bombina bombina TaxID=8345 RepID=UPI00235B299E|nr:T-cell receptor-associated transmembrane adapter 1 [Bombina bombina]
MEVWVPLAIVSMAFILSLTVNIVHCILKHRKGKEQKYFSECTVSYEHYVENNPIYGNLNQPILEHIDDTCYEQMATPQERIEEEIKVEPEQQMCYAALDLSPKKHKKNRKKKINQVENQNCMEDGSSMEHGNVLSRSSIYLNTEQLTAQCNAKEDLIHDDPVRLYHLIHKTRNNPIEDQSDTDWAN